MNRRSVSSVLFLFMLSAYLALPALALADTSSPGTAAATAGPETAAPADPAELLGGGVKVVNDWRTVGWMAGMVALCNLLMTVVRRVPFVSALLKRGPPWVAPAVVVAIGAAAGFFQGLATGGPMGALTGALGGVGAGFSAVGADTALTRMSASGAAEVNVTRAVKDALAGGDAAAAAAGDAIRTSVVAARREADPGARMRALAGLLNGGGK